MISGGRLEGANTIVGNASLSAATLAPGGSSFGKLAITGELYLFTGITLEIGVGGTTQGVMYDLLSESSGTASTSLSGTTLRLSLATGYIPSFSDSFTVFESDDPLTGSFFNAVTGTRLVTTDGLGSFVVRYGPGQTVVPNTVVLTQFQSVPEPTTAGLLGMALASLFGRRLRTPRAGR